MLLKINLIFMILIISFQHSFLLVTNYLTSTYHFTLFCYRKFFVVPESYEMAAMMLAVEEEIKEEEIAFQKSQKNEKSGKNANSGNSVNPETTETEVEKSKKRSARDTMELYTNCEEVCTNYFKLF